MVVIGPPVFSSLGTMGGKSDITAVIQKINCCKADAIYQSFSVERCDQRDGCIISQGTATWETPNPLSTMDNETAEIELVGSQS
jgi:hypothetical protein